MGFMSNATRTHQIMIRRQEREQARARIVATENAIRAMRDLGYDVKPLEVALIDAQNDALVAQADLNDLGFAG